MSRSSTFNFRTLRLRLGPIVLTVVTVGLMAMALDLVWRFTRPVETYSGWLDPNLEAKAEGIKRLAQKKGHVDVMLISTSSTRGVDVERWERAFGGKVTAWNAAVPGLRPQQVYYLVKGHLAKASGVTHIIHGIVPQDISARGGLQKWEHRKHGPYFNSWRMRAAAAENSKEKLKAAVLNMSAIVQDRSAIRTWIQGGPDFLKSPWTPNERGTSPQSLLQMPAVIPPTYMEWTRTHPQLNSLHKFEIPPDGELKMIQELAAFCRDSGITYVLVSYPWSPWGRTLYDNPEKDHKVYEAALETLRQSGVPVVDMYSALKLDESHFEDPWHDNRRGAERSTAWLYQNVVRPWFPNVSSLAGLPQEESVNLAKCSLSTGSGLPDTIPAPQFDPTVARHENSDLTVLRPGAPIILKRDAAPGLWFADIYGEHLTTDVLSREPQNLGHLRLVAGNISGQSSRDTGWGVTLQDQSATRLRIDLDATATIQLESIEAPRVLDAAYLTRFPHPAGDLAP